MKQLSFKTRGKVNPQGKPRVYFTCHPDDFARYFESLSDEILAISDCAIYYYASEADLPADEEDYYANLSQMQLFVMPVTTKLLTKPCRALEKEFAFAMKEHIPVLPLMQESGLEPFFNQKCGDLQFLDKNARDGTAISYEEKLRKYLESVLIGNELAAKVRAAFDAYIFLSYRKKDRKYAQELMRLIHQNDFCRDIAIWYDEFLTPGEDFNHAIGEALDKSRLFALAVTPNLLEKDNYVIKEEYPKAIKANKPILAAEMLPTDYHDFKSMYEGISDPIDAHDSPKLSESLLDRLRDIAKAENDNDPQHNFFIGLAYLGGIDVEVDYERAVSLITSAANAGLVEAMEKLLEMYANGNGVKRDYDKAIEWKSRINRKLQDELVNSFEETEERKRAINEYYNDGSRESFELAFEHSRALHFFTDSVVTEIKKWNISQLKLSELYRQAGNAAMSRDVLLQTIEFISSKSDVYDIYDTSGQQIVSSGCDMDTSFLDLYLKLVEYLIEERKYSAAKEWLQKTKDEFQIDSETVGAHDEPYIQLTSFMLDFTNAKILFGQEEYEEAYLFIAELSTTVTERLTDIITASMNKFTSPSLINKVSNTFGLSKDDASPSHISKQLAIASMPKDMFSLLTDISMLGGEIATRLGRNEEAKIYLISAIIFNSKADRKRDKIKEFKCHLQLAELFALADQYDEMQEHLESAEAFLKYSNESTVEISVLQREYFRKCGDIAAFRGKADDADRYYKDAIKVAEALIRDVPTAENVLYLVELYGKMCDITYDKSTIDKYIDLMYKSARSSVFEDRSLIARESLGGIYYCICKHDHNSDTVKKAYDIFSKLASEYSECNSFASKRDELKIILMQ